MGGNANNCTTSVATVGAADWTHIAGVELYDHRGDDGQSFDAFENANVAHLPEHAATVQVHKDPPQPRV